MSVGDTKTKQASCKSTLTVGGKLIVNGALCAHSCSISNSNAAEKEKKKILYHPILWREAGNTDNMTVIALNCALRPEDNRSSGSQVKR